MASIFTDLAKTLLENVMKMTISETSYICCFTCIVEDFEKEKENLKAKTKTMEQRIEVAKRRAEDIPIEVIHWKQRTNKLIEEDTKTKMTCLFGRCPNCKGRYLNGKKLTYMTEEIRSLLRFNIESFGLASRLPGVGYHSSQHYISFQSREVKYKELIDALVDVNTYIIGLQGMGGAGKTTLAKKVGKELEELKQFDYVIDTTISYTPDMRKIQDDIAAPLGLKWEDCTESERPKKLWSRLTNGEKILVILDDVWGDINFEEIGVPYSDNHKGCKILLTTRDLRVCKSMGCERTIQLDLLCDEEAWILFKKYAGISDSSPKGMLDKGKKIAKECKGLPVAIAAIAATLKGQQSQEEWKAALASLRKQKSMPMLGVDETMIEVYKCLRYSYDNTKNDKAKKLFLLCSVFQEDEEIDYEILNRLAIGVDLFGEFYEKYDEARTQVVIAKNKLIDSCLLIEEEDHVKMHDLVREVAMWIAAKMIRSINLSCKNHNSSVGREKNIKYLVCEGKYMDVFQCRFDCSKLEILIINLHNEEAHSIQVPTEDSFFENKTSLRVLHLSTKGGINKIVSLPQTIVKLSCIRSLILESLDLGDISILGNLTTLETLDFIRCTIIELPHEITKLEKLKLLKLYECSITRKSNPFEVIARCSSLEELYFEDVRVNYLLVNADEPKVELIHHNITFPPLRRFRLNTNYFVESMYSKCVCSSHIDGLISEAAIKYLMQRAEVLRLEGIKIEWRNFMPDMVSMDEGTNDLCELRLDSCQYLQRLICTKNVDNFHLQNFFSKLVDLQLVKMNKLEELCNGTLPFNFFKSLEWLYVSSCENLRSLSFNNKLNLCGLKTMILYKCPMLESLFLLSTCRSLVMLEKLKIVDCRNLKNIIKDERIGEETGDEIIDADKSYGTMFPNLRTLFIHGCGRLEFILPFLSADDVPLLETITIKSCGELKSIFGQYQRQHEQYVVLGSLKNVILDKVPNFIDIFSEECTSSMKRPYGGESSEEKMPLESTQCNVFPWTHLCCYGYKNKQKLTSTTTTSISLASKNQQQLDISISSLSNSEVAIHLWKHGHCLSKQSQILCNIKEIELSNLSKKKSIFILSLTPQMMLETLRIYNCEELKQVAIGMKDNCNSSNLGDVFPRLKYIDVQNCRQLEYIFGEYHDCYNNHNDILLHLPALESMKLDNLPNLIGICSKAYRITFPALKKLKMRNVSQFKSIGDMIVYLDSSHRDSTTAKDLSGNMKHFLALEDVSVDKANLENVCYLDEVIGQQMNFRLWVIHLSDLPHMTKLFVGGYKGSYTLQNLKYLIIYRCGRLEVVFPVSILKCFPQLEYLRITECQELKQIIEEDVKNEEIMSNTVSPMTCFPKLTTLYVEKCNELKYVLYIFTSKELPKLKYLKITEAPKLEEVFRYEHEDHKVKLPNLKYVLLVDLPNISQEIELQTLECRLVRNCPKLSPTSKSILDGMLGILEADSLVAEIDFSMYGEFQRTINVLQEEYSNAKDTSNENPSAKTTKDFPAAPAELELPSSQMITDQLENGGIESNDFNSMETEMKPTTSTEILLTDPELIIPLPKTESQEPLDQESKGEQCDVKQQQSFGETNIALKFPHKNHCLEKTEDHNAKEGSTSLAKENGDGQKTISSRSVATAEHPTTKDVGFKDSIKISNFPVTLTKTLSIDDAAAGKINLTSEEQCSNGHGIGVSESKPSSVVFQSPSMATYNLSSKGNHSQIEEKFILATPIIRELEQLVSYKYLDEENLPLLTDFIVKHPTVCLVENAHRHTNKYKGFAYGRLAELLKFLQTHSILDVLDSSNSDFEGLLEDLRHLPFDKEWLDDVERHALSPNLPISPDAWQELLRSKQHAIEKVEKLRLKVDVFTQHVEDLKHQLASSEAVLESIIQQEAQVLQARAALSVPLGY